MNKIYIEIRQIKSKIGQSRKIKKIVYGLGLSRIGSYNKFDDSPSIRGMILKIQHLLKVKTIKMEANKNV